MARVKTFINAGRLLPADLNSIQDDYETGFAVWRPMPYVGLLYPAAAAGTFMFSLDTIVQAPDITGTIDATDTAMNIVRPPNLSVSDPMTMRPSDPTRIGVATSIDASVLLNDRSPA